MSATRCAGVFLAFLFAVSAFAGETAEGCLQTDVRLFADMLKRSNDPQHREALAGCILRLRGAYLRTLERVDDLETAAKSLDDPADASHLAQRQKELKDSVADLPDEIALLEDLAIDDAKLLTTRIAEFAKSEATLTLDDATSEQLEKARRSHRKLLSVITLVDGKVALRDDAYTRLVAEAKQAKLDAKAQKALAAAEAECRKTYAHLEKVRDAAKLTHCIDLVARLLREGGHDRVEFEENVKRARLSAPLREKVVKESVDALDAARKAVETADQAAVRAAAEREQAEEAEKRAKEAKAALDAATDAAEKAQKAKLLAEKERAREREAAEAAVAAAEAQLEKAKREEAEAIAKATADAAAKVTELAAQHQAAVATKEPLSIFNVEARRLTGELARFEEAGRRLTRLRLKEIDALQEKRKNATDAQKADIDKQIKLAELDLEALKDRVIVPGEDPIHEYADYEQWYNKFSLGYEYQSITEAFSKGFPRLGFTAGFHYPRQKLPEASENFSFWRYGLYNTFSLALTNSGELKPTPVVDDFNPPASALRRYATVEEEPAPETPPVTPKVEPKRALEFEASFFLPVWRNDYQILNPRLRTRIGPYLSIGGRKIDDDTFVHHRVYGGIRTARSPETFADFLLGKSGNLRSRRLEVRGQLAVPHIFKNGSYFVLGAVGNFGINKRRHGGCEEAAPNCVPDERDSIRFYITYDIPSSGFLGFFGAGN